MPEETTPSRTPAEIQAEIVELYESASKAFVPANLLKAAELQQAFNAAVVEQLDAAATEIAALQS